MLPTSSPDRICIACDDCLVDHAGQLFSATTTSRLGLRELTDAHLAVGDGVRRRRVSPARTPPLPRPPAALVIPATNYGGLYRFLHIAESVLISYYASVRYDC